MLRTEIIRPLSELLRNHARVFGDRVAFEDATRAVTYTELELRTRRIAGHLAAHGVHRGDRVLISLGNRVECLESYYAVNRAGAVGVPVDPRATDPELAHLLDDSGAIAVLTDRAHVGQLRRLGRELLTVVVGGTASESALDFEELAGTEPAVAAPDDLGLDENAWMLYTSGTTGQPKGVLSTQRNCLWSIASAYMPVLGLSAEDRVLWPMPLFHSLGHVLCVHGVLAAGASARIMPGFSADDVLGLLRREPFTFLVGVPTMFHHLLRESEDSGLAMPSLRACLVTGSVATASLKQDFTERFGVPLVDSYGSTETNGAITMNRPGEPQVAGSCGLPVPGLGVRVVDPHTHEDTDVGEEGEVWVRGPSVMLGYYGRREETDLALRDGWYRTGDLATRDAAGYLTISGRIKELIIRGGENIHPAEIEDVVRVLPGVADVAVAGRPHEILGETPAVYVVPSSDGFDAAAALAVCRDALPYYKVPEEVYRVEEIPRTSTGKITRHTLVSDSALLLATTAARGDWLYRLDWREAPTTDVPPPTCAVLDRDTLGLAHAVDLNDSDPRLVFAHFVPEADDVRGVIAEAERAVGDWLADQRSADARLVLVTQGPVLAPIGQNPVHTAVWGVLRTAMAERPGRFAMADMDDHPDSPSALVAALAAGETEVAVRGGRAHVPRLTNAASTTQFAVPALSGTALVVGDGEPASAIAEHLVAKHGVSRAVLAATPDEVEERLAHDRPSVVVHTGLDPDGLWRLHERTADLALEAFIVCTAAAGVLGAPDSAERAGRSAYADAVVRHRRAEGLPATSLAWGPWAGDDGFGEAGRPWWKGHGVAQLTREEGLALFDAARAVDGDVLVPLALSTADLRGKEDSVPAALRGAVPNGGETLRTRLDDLSPFRRRAVLRDLVRAEAAAVLGLSAAAGVGATTAFKDLGFTSVGSVELRNRLNRVTGLDLTVTVVFDHPTPQALADHLHAELLDEADEPLFPEARPSFSGEPIAIVGMGCRYPGGAVSPEELWRLVQEGRDVVSAFPEDRGWDLDALFSDDPDRPGTSLTRSGGF
uniref:AMP-binding protein n=1 Tax=Nocardiopsis listeri TaxID=53440 RepID=UPI000A81596B